MTLAFLALLTVALGNSRTFLNMSTLHGFYAQRLTRAYLGASNRERLYSQESRVTDSMPEDDLPADQYWNCPHVPDPSKAWVWVDKARSALRRKHEQTNPASTGPVERYGPLHLVNVTVNETLDGRTRVQNQDRKGVGLAIGPAGFSLGVRHHLIADDKQGYLAPGDHHHKVFRELGADPEPLTLGRWAGISGAAFTTASGSRTTRSRFSRPWRTSDWATGGIPV